MSDAASQRNDTRSPSTGRRSNDDAMTSAIEALNKAVDALTRTVETLQTAIFGRWDATTNEMIPGIHDELGAVEQRLSKVENMLKRGAWIGGGVLAVVFLKAIGVPTDQVAKIVTLVFSHLGG